jgi:LPS export ABC transporter protein LptC
MTKKYCIIITILSLLALQACTSKLNKSSAFDKSLLEAEKGDSVTILYSTNGYVKAKISSKTFVQQDANQSNTEPFIEMKDGLKIIFFDEVDSVSSILTAKKGRYFTNNKNILLRDSVQVHNKKKEELYTDELIWNEKSKLFFTEKNVVIKTTTQVIYGKGMEANQDFSKYKILQPNGIIAVDKAY